MFSFEEVKKSMVTSVWFMFLTFPILVIRVNTVENIVEWRWLNMVLVGVTAFTISFMGNFLIKRKQGAYQDYC